MSEKQRVIFCYRGVFSLDILFYTRRPPDRRAGSGGFVNRKLNGHPMLPKHIWLGVSVENQKYTSRIQHLQRVPARVRFLSIEPLLGTVELTASMLRGIHWVIVGGESGHKARLMNPDWAVNVQRACRRHGVPFFFKQWGAHNAEGKRVGKKEAGRVLNGRTWDEMPELVRSG